MARFELIMDPVLKWEGGFVDNPFDNGGPTKFGITHTVLAQWKGVSGVTREEVKALTKAEAIEIFREKYWERIRGSLLPEPLDLVLMDGAVNHGVENSARMLQKILGITEDGKIGNSTILSLQTKISSGQPVESLVVLLAESRKSRYLNHEDVSHFLAGWRNRLNDVVSIALRGSGMSWTFDEGEGAAGNEAQYEPSSHFIRPVIIESDLQHFLFAAGAYAGKLDGIFGKHSVSAMLDYFAAKSSGISGAWTKWSIERQKIALGQLLCLDVGINPGRIDGLIGPLTLEAFEEFNRQKIGNAGKNWRDEVDKLPPKSISTTTTWPAESDVPDYFGDLGKGCVLVPLKRLQLPYSMKLAWDLSVEISAISLHEKVYDSAARVFDKFYAHYGDDGIIDLGLDLFGGSSNCRKKKGGSSWSMHAWSIAIDFDPARNELSWDHKKARLAKPDAARFWEFWEAEGWVSLGRTADFDWMHVQAARRD